MRAAVWTAWISTKSVETTREPLVPESLAERSFRGKEGVGQTSGTLTKWVLFDLIGFLPIDAS